MKKDLRFDSRFDDSNFIDWNELIGKTIKSVDTSSDNVVNLQFTDDTKICIDTELIFSGLYTPVLYEV